MPTETRNILICGTGGQGILLASEIVSAAAMLSGLDVRKSEVHGMAQRGGSVVSQVRFGTAVYSPIVEEGTADLLVSMEKMEALRWAHFLSPSGCALVCNLEIEPSSVSTGQAQYPDAEGGLRARGISYTLLDAFEEAKILGDLRVVNTIMVGAASARLDLARQSWLDAIRDLVPEKALDVNFRAFDRGIELAGKR
jgi:indolepyruvate ferredoxin oxidoreductase beta subunit